MNDQYLKLGQCRTLVSVTLLVRASSLNQRVSSLIPGQGAYLDGRFTPRPDAYNPWSACLRAPLWACTGGSQLMLFSHIDVCLSPFLCLFLSLSLKSNEKMSSSEDKKYFKKRIMLGQCRKTKCTMQRKNTFINFLPAFSTSFPYS